MYLFKLCDKSVFTLLRNSSIKILSKISKTRLILWMFPFCNLIGLDEVGKLGRN